MADTLDTEDQEAPPAEPSPTPDLAIDAPADELPAIARPMSAEWLSEEKAHADYAAAEMSRIGSTSLLELNRKMYPHLGWGPLPQPASTAEQAKEFVATGGATRDEGSANQINQAEPASTKQTANHVSVDPRADRQRVRVVRHFHSRGPKLEMADENVRHRLAP